MVPGFEINRGPPGGLHLATVPQISPTPNFYRKMITKIQLRLRNQYIIVEKSGHQSVYEEMGYNQLQYIQGESVARLLITG